MAKEFKLSVRDLRKLRRDVVSNVQEHCQQLYKRGSMTKDACMVAAAIAAAEISDVIEKNFHIKF